MTWRIFVLKYQTPDLVEKLVPERFIKNQNWVYMQINNHKFYKGFFFVVCSSKGLPNHIKSKITILVSIFHWPASIVVHCVKNVHIWSFPGPYFPAFGLNTVRYSVFNPNAGKIRIRKTPNMDTFHAVIITRMIWTWCIASNIIFRLQYFKSLVSQLESCSEFSLNILTT